jgi:hypothetical protein
VEYTAMDSDGVRYPLEAHGEQWQAHRYQAPILIEVHDVVHNTVPLIKAMCERPGLDPAEIRYEWERVEIVDSFVDYDALLVNR